MTTVTIRVPLGRKGKPEDYTEVEGELVMIILGDERVPFVAHDAGEAMRITHLPTGYKLADVDLPRGTDRPTGTFLHSVVRTLIGAILDDKGGVDAFRKAVKGVPVVNDFPLEDA